MGSVPLITRKRFYKFFFGLFGLFILAAGLIYWQLRDLEQLKLLVVEQLQELTQRQVGVHSISFDLSEGIGLKLHHLVLTDPDKPTRVFTAKEAGVTMGVWSILKQDAQIQKLSLHGAKLKLTRRDRRGWEVEGLGGFTTDHTPGDDQIEDGWKRVRRLDLKDSTLIFVDPWNKGESPVRLVANNVNASISKPLLKTSLLFMLEGNISGPSDRNSPFRVNGRWKTSTLFPDTPELEGTLQLVDGYVPLIEKYLDKIFAIPPTEKSISTNSEFSWHPGKQLNYLGKLFLSKTHGTLPKDEFHFPKSPEGTIDFDVTVKPDLVQFHKLDYHAGAFNFKVKGAYVGHSKKNPRVQLNVSSSPFAVHSTKSLLPFKLFFPKTHDSFHDRFKDGSLEIRSFGFNGTLDQLNNLSQPESLDRLKAELYLQNMNFGPELPQLKKVTGSLKLMPGKSDIHISKAEYQDFSISGLSGNVTRVMQHPVVSWTIDGNFKLQELKSILGRVMDTRSFEDQLAFFKDLKGESSVHLHIRGPLEEPDKLEIEGAMELSNASFKQDNLTKPFEDIKGRIRFTNRPENPMLKTRDGELPWEVKLEGLSGNIGPHQITELAGETTLEKGSPVRRVYGKVKLGLLEAAELASGSLLGRFQSVLEEVSFSGGEVLLDFRGRGAEFSLEPSGPLGLVGLKKVTLQHKAGFRPLIDVSGFLYFDENKIRLETQEAWYGDSPVEIKGQYLFMDSKNPELVLRASSSEFKPTDFADIPFLETLKYDGLAKLEFIWQSNQQYKKFENHVDLTQVEYKYDDWLIKPKGVRNKLATIGRVLPNGGLNLNKLTFELEDNKVTGHARIEQPSNPQFSAHLEAKAFETFPMASYIPALKSNRGGVVEMSLDGQGNVRRLENALFKGTAQLKQLQFKPEGFVKTLTVDGDVNWTGLNVEISNGRLEADKTRTKFDGRYYAGPAPQLELKLRGDGVYLSELLPEPGSKEELEKPGWWRTSRLLSQGSGSVDIQLDRFNVSKWNLKELKGKMSFKGKQFDFKKLSVGRENRDRIEAQGILSLADPKKIGFDGIVMGRNIRAEGFLGVFGPIFDDSLDGQLHWFKAKLDSSGGTLKEIFGNLNGDVAFDVAKGQLQTYRLRNGVNKLFGFSGTIKPKQLRLQSSPYINIFGNFVVKNGMARTENFLFEEPNQRMSLVGDFDMERFQMDTVVGVAPLRELDRFLSKIPLVGKIITAGDEQSLFKNYYTVRGGFDNPEVSPIPFTSLGKKVVGIFQGIIQSPTDLIPETRTSNE